MRMKPIAYENQLLVGQRLELTDKDGHYCLGPNLIVQDCTVILSLSPGWMHIRSAKFINCTIDVKRDLSTFQGWVHASLKGCRFRGRIPGADFGRWPDFTEYAKEGAIEDCDFSESRLNGCQFHGCDMRTIRLPRWPCFTFLDPFNHHAELQSVAWPERFGGVVIESLGRRIPPSMVALTYHAPTVARRFKTTPEDLKGGLEKLSCVYF